MNNNIHMCTFMSQFDKGFFKTTTGGAAKFTVPNKNVQKQN